jgi:hypothetical protein
LEGITLLFKVLWSPGEAMFRVAKNNKAALAPILLLTIGGIVFTMIMFSHVDMYQLALRALEQRPGAQELTAEQKDRMLAMSTSTFARVTPMIFAGIGPTLTITCVSFIYFVLFTLVGRTGGYKAFFAITSFAFVPLIVRNVASALTVMVVPPSSLMVDEIGGISPSIFLDRTATSRGVFTLVNQIDVVSIWILILLVVGYRFLVSKDVSIKTRAACVFGPWFIWIAVRVALSSVFPA